MIATIFTGTARYRRPILGAAVVLAASILWLRPQTAPHGSLALLVVASGALAILAQVWPRPAALTVDPRRSAFRALPAAASVCTVVTLIFVSAMEIGIDEYLQSSADPDQGPHFLGTVQLTDMTVLLVGLCAVILVLTWRETGLQLRPDGLIHHTLVGTVIVPWEALAPGYPGRGRSLVLAYARPELVRRRYLASRRKLATQVLNVDPLFLGAVIAHYIAYPQHRPAIGSQAEYDRLRHAVTNPVGPLPATSR